MEIQPNRIATDLEIGARYWAGKLQGVVQAEVALELAVSVGVWAAAATVAALEQPAMAALWAVHQKCSCLFYQESEFWQAASASRIWGASDSSCRPRSGNPRPQHTRCSSRLRL